MTKTKVAVTEKKETSVLAIHPPALTRLEYYAGQFMAAILSTRDADARHHDAYAACALNAASILIKRMETDHA